MDDLKDAVVWVTIYYFFHLFLFSAFGYSLRYVLIIYEKYVVFIKRMRNRNGTVFLRQNYRATRIGSMDGSICEMYFQI